MLLQSLITCPRCGATKSETMPTNACQFYYECTGCGVRLRPKEGDLLRVLLLWFGTLSTDSSRAFRRDESYFLLRGLSRG